MSHTYIWPIIQEENPKGLSPGYFYSERMIDIGSFSLAIMDGVKEYHRKQPLPPGQWVALKYLDGYPLEDIRGLCFTVTEDGDVVRLHSGGTTEIPRLTSWPPRKT